MKIVLATHNLDTGGIGTLTRGLAAALPSALASTDHLALAGLCPDGLPNQNVECLDGGRIVRYRFGRHLYEQARLARAARRADLLHLVEPRPVLSSRTPFVLTLHDVFFLDRPDWYPRVTRRFKRAMLTAALAKRPRAVICVSRFTRERLLAHCEPHDDTRLEVVHPGLNRPRNQDLEPVAGRPYFLTVAAIEPRKNHLVLLEAFRLARSRGLELNWKVVGGRGYCSRAITKALSEQPGVDLVGLVSDRERDRLYQGSMFCAFPSRAEGFGFPPLEAMAFGRAVICSTESALDETVGDAAIRVASHDVEGWADALVRLEADAEERRSLADAGRRHAAQFAWQNAAARHVEIYRAAISQ